jgi:hypothetical protein
MALTACPECGGKVSTDARACPHCGKPLRPSSYRLLVRGVLWGGIAVVLLWVGFAFALPGMLRSPMAANEAEVVGLMHTIASAQKSFQDTAVVDINSDGVGDYGTLAELAAKSDDLPPYVDPELASGTKAGYSFTVEVEYGVEGTEPAYTCLARPVVPGRSGFRQFFVDDSGVIRFTADGTDVGENSVPLH